MVMPLSFSLCLPSSPYDFLAPVRAISSRVLPRSSVRPAQRVRNPRDRLRPSFPRAKQNEAGHNGSAMVPARAACPEAVSAGLDGLVVALDQGAHLFVELGRGVKNLLLGGAVVEGHHLVLDARIVVSVALVVALVADDGLRLDLGTATAAAPGPGSTRGLGHLCRRRRGRRGRRGRRVALPALAPGRRARRLGCRREAQLALDLAKADLARALSAAARGTRGGTSWALLRTLATSAFLNFCSAATASQSMSALLRVCLTMAKKNMASAALGSFLGVVTLLFWSAMSAAGPARQVSVRARALLLSPGRGARTCKGDSRLWGGLERAGGALPSRLLPLAGGVQGGKGFRARRRLGCLQGSVAVENGERKDRRVAS